MAKQVPAQQGFAKTHFSCQHGEPTTGNAKSEMVQCFQMMAAGKKEIGIRRQAKWGFRKPQLLITEAKIECRHVQDCTIFGVKKMTNSLLVLTVYVPLNRRPR